MHRIEKFAAVTVHFGCQLKNSRGEIPEKTALALSLLK
jgi:hypothetical protein